MPELDDTLLFGDGADDTTEADGADGAQAGDSHEEHQEGPDLEAMAERGEEEAQPKPQPQEREKPSRAERREVKALQDRVREIEAESAYWKGRAEAGAGNRRGDDDGEPERPAPRRSKQDDVDDSAELLESLSKDGSKALKARGFVSMDEVERIVEQRIGQAQQALHSDAQLMRQYPDLNDPKSDFSKRVAAEVQEMIRHDKSLAKSNGTIAAAARIVKAEMAAEDARKGGADRDRERRISKQGPVNGRGGGGYDDDGPSMQPGMRGMLRGLSVPESQYKAEHSRLARGGR